MSEEWKELSKIPGFTMKNNDGWGYRCEGFSDIIEVTYFEKAGKEVIDRSSFNVPTFCAEQLFTELAKLAKDAKEHNED